MTLKLTPLRFPLTGHSAIIPTPLVRPQFYVENELCITLCCAVDLNNLAYSFKFCFVYFTVSDEECGFL